MTDKPEMFTAYLSYDPEPLLAPVVTLRICEVHRWLADNRCSHHLINIYDNTDAKAGIYRLAVVLTDRDTAIMLKLALA